MKDWEKKGTELYKKSNEIFAMTCFNYLDMKGLLQT